MFSELGSLPRFSVQFSWSLPRFYYVQFCFWSSQKWCFDSLHKKTINYFFCFVVLRSACGSDGRFCAVGTLLLQRKAVGHFQWTKAFLKMEI